ncbi:hypothetical protein [Arthrobacter sp. YD2]|uniref:hypothetical protein n=1 Tax=Arthrobacter sp. YD2 TaxID=3058046 RepID=UPI0025B357E3|nr:hypothetical protein [Arthrobacter sp. YD2]MDN3905233.1 hypothetical protein [Arthrobacter sp. YD2]
MDSNTAFILNEYRARQAVDRRDYGAAIEYSMIAAAKAAEANDGWGFCRMTFNVAELQLGLGLMDECIATCGNLFETDAIKQYPDYESRAKVLVTRAMHNRGEMGDALVTAREASRLPMQELSSEGRLSVQHVLVAALAEEGDTETAWEEAVRLAGMLDDEPQPRVAGMAYWAIGNAGFMSGRIGAGLNYHRLAAESLAMVDDVSLWGLFNKASAHMRLASGLVTQETVECIERAEVAYEVVRVTEIDGYEITITRAWWELETGNPGIADKLLISIEAKVAGPYPFLLGRTLQLRARCLDALGQEAAAMECAQKSERIFTEVGAEVLAADSRKIRDALGQSAR